MLSPFIKLVFQYLFLFLNVVLEVLKLLYEETSQSLNAMHS
jgi:hypothetical protein